ncbi:transcription elongation factor Spt6 [Trichodelitschia bisporula]|uniref:Transcription elongation factor Spt6 n=1 Tax=Trichodelitschia bisporula TaxID=703511 RepID=A0A6G1HUT7_9PEZI|nr:transcription elongation factor Spt6 [Trichodelitschia bisporula]
MASLVDIDAEVGSEEDYEDEEEGIRRPKASNGALDDSSEEEEDDDEELAKAVAEGFIVDEDEEEEGEEEVRRPGKHRRKRRRAEREIEEEALDEEDLDLIGEHIEPKTTTKHKFKRLKQGHRQVRTAKSQNDIFSDDEDDEEGHVGYKERTEVDEFADFIESDEFEDEERDRMIEEQEVARPGRKPLTGFADIDISGFDEQTMEDYRAAFGDGNEYEWALRMQAEADETAQDDTNALSLKDVFEPSQLVDKMMTDEDNVIRLTDIPERHQIARKAFRLATRTEGEAKELLKEEAKWIADLILPKKRFDRFMHEPLTAMVGKILDFMVTSNFEVPFIMQQRKDYLIYDRNANGDVEMSDDHYDGPAPEKLLNQEDLWDIFDFDLRWNGLVEKRDALNAAYSALRDAGEIDDPLINELLPKVVNVEDVQDLMDYFHFQYSAQLKDLSLMEQETNGALKRAKTRGARWERLRASRAYTLVRAVGITADAFAQNVSTSGPRQYTEDPAQLPDDLADALLDPPEFSTGQKVLQAAMAMFSEQLAMSPRLRRFIRQEFYYSARFDCIRTAKGAKTITEEHRYYEFKYLRNQDVSEMARRPELFLRMLKAESEGLVEVKITLINRDAFKQKLYSCIVSDNVSDIAEAWNRLRREMVDMAFEKLETHIARGVKETLKAECETQLAKACRGRFNEKLDQAPYKPKGTELGTTPRVLAMSNGNGVPGHDAVCWIFMDDDGRIPENGKYTDLRPGNPEKYLPDGKDVEKLVDLIKRRKPDVIGISGFKVEARKLYKDVQEIIDKFDLTLEIDDPDEETSKVEVIMVNDEVARLYQSSPRAAVEFPSFPPLGRYCVALARYLRNPMLEYASLGKDITSINWDPNQDLVPKEKLFKYLETALIDIVNLVGVNMHEATSNPQIANLLQYVSGLGPRKANHILTVIGRNGGNLKLRSDLVGDDERGIAPAVGATIFANCASFLYLEYDETDDESDYLDSTRIHPEDYDMARKMAADACDWDEEDIAKNGIEAAVREFVREEMQAKADELDMDEYSQRLLIHFNLRKRATLETIRAELQAPYEELRRSFLPLTHDEIYTMLTGDTLDSLQEQMVVPVKIRRVFQDHIEVRLTNGLEGGIGAEQYPDGVGGDRGVDPRTVYSTHQTVQAKILYLNRKALTAQLSLKEDVVRRPFRRHLDHLPGEWDHEQEEADRKTAQAAKEAVAGRPSRVIKHPNFRAMNAKEAQEYLGSQSRGDVVIRPSSKGLDHIAVTWKVSDYVYDHIDVLELDKASPFELGKTLTIGGRYRYSDLDELIVLHVKGMARKVDEMMNDERYQSGTKAQTEQWLSTYTEANPRRSMYGFCINPKYPGWFWLIWKAGRDAKLMSWPVKVLPGGFELMKNSYPDMRALKNGFKMLYTSMNNGGR